VRQRFRMVELQRWRDKRGLKFHLRPANWPFNARLADGVAIEAGHDPDHYLRRAFAAVWEDQFNLADPATIAKLADESGLPGRQLVARSGAQEITAAYEPNRQDALAADVFGSPVDVLEGEGFWGQDRLELREDALKSGRAPYSSRVQGRLESAPAVEETGTVLRREQAHEHSEIVLEIIGRHHAGVLPRRLRSRAGGRDAGDRERPLHLVAGGR
jgi:hypothetical protein